MLRTCDNLKGLPVDSPFLLRICPKLCYFIHEYECLLPERSAISEKLAKHMNACGRTAPQA